MLNTILVIAFALSPRPALAAKRPVCLAELSRGIRIQAYRLIDQTYAVLFPEQAPPMQLRREALARVEKIASATTAFEQMPHDYAKFEFALKHLDISAMRVKNMRASGITAATLSEAEAHRGAIALFHEFVQSVVLRSYGLAGNQRMADLPRIALTNEDVRFAQAVLRRAEEALHVPLQPAQTTPPSKP